MSAEMHITEKPASFNSNRWLPALVLGLAISVAPPRAEAQAAERTGKQVVDATCSTCHRTGANGAPRIGDKKAWSKLASRGLTGLSQSALKGIRNMPPHGGNLTYTDTEIERAITYMINQSGGHWTEPVSRATPAAERTGKQIVQARCVNCHATGVGGAPKIGDLAAWIPRVKPGLDVVVRSAINGHGPMPPRGGMADLTDAEVKSAIVYMMNKDEGATK
jgi:cytochrome c5